MRTIFSMFRSAGSGKLFNFFKVESSYLISSISKKPVVWGLPWSVSIEAVNFCNLRCPECPVGAGELNRSRGTMAWELYKKIVDQHARKLLYLMLYFQGEPFLHPEIFKMIRYAHANGIYVMTSTNGHFLSHENNKKLLHSGLDKLIVSLDGLDQESYSRYRKGGDFRKVREGIQDLVQARKDTGSSFPELEMQVLLMKHTAHRKKEFRRLARELGVDRLRFKSLQVIHEEGLRFLPEEGRSSRYRQKGDEWYIRSNLPDRCGRLWRNAVYLSDGRMVPCCFDKQGQYIMGNGGTQAAKMIWQGKHFEDFRKKVLSGRQELELCRNCTSGIKKRLPGSGQPLTGLS